jgi:nicotinamide riboside transporter PnuC
MAAPVSPNNFLSAKIFFQVNFTALMLVNMVMIQVTITRIFCWSSWLPLSKIHSKHLLNNYLRKGKVIPWLCLGNAAMLRKTFCNDLSCNCKGSFRDEFQSENPFCRFATTSFFN